MTEKFEKGEQEIIEITRRMVAFEGITNVSIGKIAKEFGSSKSQIYYYFVSKDQIFNRMVDEQIADYYLLARNNGYVSEMSLKVKNMLDYILGSDRQPGFSAYVLLSLFQQYPEGSTIKDKLIKLFESIRYDLEKTLLSDKRYSGVQAGRLAEDMLTMISGKIIFAYSMKKYDQLNTLNEDFDKYI
jgi:AcrR family transcriptional regulator